MKQKSWLSSLLHLNEKRRWNATACLTIPAITLEPLCSCHWPKISRSYGACWNSQHVTGPFFGSLWLKKRLLLIVIIRTSQVKIRLCNNIYNLVYYCVSYQEFPVGWTLRADRKCYRIVQNFKIKSLGTTNPAHADCITNQDKYTIYSRNAD